MSPACAVCRAAPSSAAVVTATVRGDGGSLGHGRVIVVTVRMSSPPSGSVAVSSTSYVCPGATSKIVPANCSGTVRPVTVDGSTRNSGVASRNVDTPAMRTRVAIVALWFASPAIKTWMPIVWWVARSTFTSLIASAFCAAARRVAKVRTRTRITRMAPGSRQVSTGPAFRPSRGVPLRPSPGSYRSRAAHTCSRNRPGSRRPPAHSPRVSASGRSAA